MEYKLIRYVERYGTITMRYDFNGTRIYKPGPKYDMSSWESAAAYCRYLMEDDEELDTIAMPGLYSEGVLFLFGFDTKEITRRQFLKIKELIEGRKIQFDTVSVYLYLEKPEPEGAIETKEIKGKDIFLNLI